MWSEKTHTYMLYMYIKDSIAYRPVARQRLRKNNETTATARQQLRKYATVLEPLLGSGPLLEAVLSMLSAPRLYFSTDKTTTVANVCVSIPVLLNSSGFETQ
jgi:hypothetical protein